MASIGPSATGAAHSAEGILGLGGSEPSFLGRGVGQVAGLTSGGPEGTLHALPHEARSVGEPRFALGVDGSEEQPTEQPDVLEELHLLLLAPRRVGLGPERVPGDRGRDERAGQQGTAVAQHQAFALVERIDDFEQRIADLDGKVIVTTSGTNTERTVRNVLTMRKISGLFKGGRSHRESLGMVISSQADAFVIDDALLSGLIASSAHPEKVRIIDENFGYEPYSIVMRRDDPELKRIVDQTLRGMMQSGELGRLYNKWFLSPIPPKGINLNLPMSDLLKELIRNPNDEGN